MSSSDTLRDLRFHLRDLRETCEISGKPTPIEIDVNDRIKTTLYEF